MRATEFERLHNALIEPGGPDGAKDAAKSKKRGLRFNKLVPPGAD